MIEGIEIVGELVFNAPVKSPMNQDLGYNLGRDKDRRFVLCIAAGPIGVAAKSNEDFYNIVGIIDIERSYLPEEVKKELLIEQVLLGL